MKGDNMKGVTLVELLVVIAVFAVLVAMALPNMAGWVTREDAREVSQRILQVLRSGRGSAIAANREYRVEFDLDQNDDTYSYRLLEGDRPSGSTAFTLTSVWDDSDIPRSVALRGGAGCDATDDVAFLFSPNGSVAATGHVCVFEANDMAAGRKYRIGITSTTTGRVVID